MASVSPKSQPAALPSQPEAPTKADLAAQAVVGKPSSKDAPLLTPTIEAIWSAFKADGSDDKDMFKLLLQAKVKEDERLAAQDNLRAEQLRAANTLAMHQYAFQYQQVYAAQAALAVAAQAQALKGPPPYSPTSPPPSEPSSHKSSGKRSRAVSDASSTSSHSDSATKKAKTSDKPTHADVMAALRRKCETNKGVSPPMGGHAQLAPPPGYFPQYPPYASPPLAPASRLAPAAPVTTTTGRRNSPPHVPGRHTSFLRPAPPPPSSSASSTGARSVSPLPSGAVHPASPPLASVAEADEQPPTPVAATPRNKLALLLHASESSDLVGGPAPPAHWQPPKPKVLAATSDCRGEA
ncbi:hypothetical protein JCM10207_000297 [Rhodosporidiobolus poonsookiae]